MSAKPFLYSLSLLLLMLLQFTLSPISYKGCGPDYIMIFVICTALFEKERYGAVIGLISGLICDYADGFLFGYKGILFMAVGYLIGFLINKILSLNILTVYFLFIITFFINQFLYYEIFSAINSKQNIGAVFFNFTLPQFLISLPFVAAIYGMFFLFLNKKEKGYKNI